MSVKDVVTVAAFRGGWRAVRYLPEPAAYRLFTEVADAAARRRTKGAVRLRANLSRVVPDADDATLDALVRDGLRHYFWYWCDAFRLPDWDSARVIGRIRTVNEHVLREAHAAGRGLVGALPHIGNWDHAGAWVIATGIPVTTVAERLRPEAVYEQFLEFREGLGMTIYPLTGGDGDLFAQLGDAVRANHFVPLLADRDLTDRGIRVQFFGQDASMPAGPAVLALRTGAPLIPMSTWYEGVPPDHGLVVRFEEPVPVPQGTTKQKVQVMTQALADIFAERIAEHPTDWHMLQKLFRADLTPR